MAASTSMPPPSTSFAHRRNRLSNSSPSRPSFVRDSESCSLRKMSLSKGATFHYPSSSPQEDDPVLSIPHLARRSPTSSQSLLASWLSEKTDVSQELADFEESFSGARGSRPSSRRRFAQDFAQQLFIKSATLPLDEGLGSSISATSDKNIAQSLERAFNWVSNKDSGLGTSIASDKEPARNSEEDGLVTDLVQETNSSPASPTRLRSNRQATRSNSPNTAVTYSIAPPVSRTKSKHPPLSSFARKRINQYILDPILRESRFEILHPLVTSLGDRKNKSIRCLRDLERSLIFQPLTFTTLTRQIYRAFGEFSVQLVVDTYHQLSESDQRRVSDRPYDNGYFLDLVQQVGTLAAQVGTTRQAQLSGEPIDEMAYSPEDEVTLEGGLGSDGTIAELVRWKNGQGISLRTGRPYEPLAGFKRQGSELDDEAERSMARRKKGYIPEIIEMKCSDPTCDKIFNRKCDLAKHEKTHSRPFKCPTKGCKYHELGLPTEKERDRHINDKHASNPHFYKCGFCEFKTKRESNCKQHMEKKHNWEYQRAKGKDKAIRGTPSATPQTPLMEYSSSNQSPVLTNGYDGLSPVSGSSIHLTPAEQAMHSFDFNSSNNAPLFPRPQQFVQASNNFGFQTPAYFGNYGYDQKMIASNNGMIQPPITPAWSNITDPSPHHYSMDMGMENLGNTDWNGMPTPESHLQALSNNPSISNQSPMFVDASNMGFMTSPIVTRDLGFHNGNTDFNLFDNNANGFDANATEASLFPDEDVMDGMTFGNDNMFDDYQPEFGTDTMEQYINFSG